MMMSALAHLYERARFDRENDPRLVEIARARSLYRHVIFSAGETSQNGVSCPVNS
jgi:hypothetical protein